MITKSDPNIWCDYCKLKWGKNSGGWHPKAMTAASVTVHSTNSKSNSKRRHYCNECVLEVTTFQGYRWGLDSQIESVGLTQLEIGA